MDFGLGDIFSISIITDMRDIYSFVFNLFIISVGFLDRLVIGVLDGLVVGDGFGHFDCLAQSGVVILDILSFIWNFFISFDILVISVVLLNWNVFNSGLCLGSSVELGRAVVGTSQDDRAFQALSGVDAKKRLNY